MENRFKGLTKKEILHLLNDVVKDSIIDDLFESFEKTREWQKINDIKCWECESIERKLKNEIKTKM